MLVRRARACGRFSLVEVMVGTAILGLASIGLIGGILQARRMAENNVWFITAVTVAQGYVEQIKSMEYAEVGENPIPTRLDQEHSNPLVPDEWNFKLVDLFDTPEKEGDDLRMWVHPVVTEITDAARRYEITLCFRWQAPASGGGFRTYERRIDFIRSYVPRS